MSMKRFIMVAAVLVLLATPVLWSTEFRGPVAEAAPPIQQGPADGQTITVTGFGTAYGAPDIVMVVLGAEAINADILTALNDVNSRVDAVIQALQAQGVAAEDIRTENFSIYQDYSGYGGPMPAEAGQQPAPVYRVSITMNITVRDTTQVGELLAAAVSAGANIVNYIQFDIANRGALESEARGLAVDDARARAEELAGLLGLTVGEVVNVVENGPQYQPYLGGGGGGLGGAQASVPPISQGTLSVSLSITVTFALNPAS